MRVPVRSIHKKAVPLHDNDQLLYNKKAQHLPAFENVAKKVYVCINLVSSIKKKTENKNQITKSKGIYKQVLSVQRKIGDEKERKKKKERKRVREKRETEITRSLGFLLLGLSKEEEEEKEACETGFGQWLCEKKRRREEEKEREERRCRSTDLDKLCS